MRIRALLSTLLLLWVVAPLRGEYPPCYIYKISPGGTFYPFTLEDLEKKNWSRNGMLGKPVIILTAHRSVRYDLRVWADRLKKEFADPGAITLLWVVNLSRYPWEASTEHPADEWNEFRPTVPLILDWHAIIGRHLRVDYSTPNIIGIDSSGNLAFHDKTPCTKEAYLLISAKIGNLLKKDDYWRSPRPR